MHVLVIAQYFPPDLGGAATRAFNVAKGLAANGCKVTVITAFPHYPYGIIPQEYKWKPLKVEKINNIKVIRTLIIPVGSKGFLKRLLLIGSFFITSLFAFPWVGKIDVIWAPSWLAGIVYSKLKRVPVALNVDDLTIEDVIDLKLFEEESLILKIGTLVYRFFYVKGDAITPISPGYIQTICKKYCVKKERIHVVRGGVDLSLFTQIEKPVNSKKFTVLYIGVLGIGYDFDQIMDAAQLVAQTDPNVEFIFHGGGESLQYLKDTIKRRQLPNVKLMDKILDSRKDVVAFMNTADVLILPMRDFGHPYLGIATKLYEYQAIGKPIICCGNGQPARFVTETASGIVVKPGDYKGIAEAVLILRINPEMAKTLGNNGRKYVEKEASIEAIGAKMKQTLKSLRSQWNQTTKKSGV